jgi:hypothetical protein
MPKTPPAKPSNEVTKYQAFTILRIRRDEIKNCPYNPRVISAANARKLRRSIEGGLLHPINFNITTGHCYGGNQRLAALDALEKNSTYLLDVAAAKLTLPQEKAACVRLNNDSLMGDWDLPVLADLLGSKDVVPEDTGFEEIQIEALLGDMGKGLFSEDAQTPETTGAVDDMTEMAEGRAEEQAAAKGRREAIRDATKAEHAKEDSERIGYVMFPSRKAREDWVEGLGLGRNERYVPARLVSRKKGV